MSKIISFLFGPIVKLFRKKRSSSGPVFHVPKGAKSVEVFYQGPHGGGGSGRLTTDIKASDGGGTTRAVVSDKQYGSGGCGPSVHDVVLPSGKTEYMDYNDMPKGGLDVGKGKVSIITKF